MPNNFQRVMDLTMGNIAFTNCYLDDILVASKVSFTDNKNILYKIFSILDSYNFAVKWPECKFFRKIEWFGFKLSTLGIAPLIDKTKAIKVITFPKYLKQLRSCFGSSNQYIKLVPNLVSFGSL